MLETFQGPLLLLLLLLFWRRLVLLRPSIRLLPLDSSCLALP
jgi:hypothetical protein